MNNRQVCDYVKTLKEHKLNQDYVCDSFVKSGYGQTTGGYIVLAKVVDFPNAEPSQKEHFLDYYGKIPDKLPTYSYLRCPQLILFIAEISGVPHEVLTRATNIIMQYEDKNDLTGSNDKSGNYLWGKQVFRDFKYELKFSQIVRIIKYSNDWGTIFEQVKNLEFQN